MSPEAQQIAIAKARGWTDVKMGQPWMTEFPEDFPNIPCGVRPENPERTAPARWGPVPNYLADLNAMHEARAVIRDNTELRVKYLNALRRIVARRCPKNKSGMSLVSDFHQLDATAAEHAEAFLSTLGLWKEDA